MQRRDLEAHRHGHIRPSGGAVYRSDRQRILHRWAGLAVTLGFPEISDQARKTQAFLDQASPPYAGLEETIKNARRRFSMAARTKPRLPIKLLTGLAGMRIGLLDFLRGRSQSNTELCPRHSQPRCD